MPALARLFDLFLARKPNLSRKRTTGLTCRDVVEGSSAWQRRTARASSRHRRQCARRPPRGSRFGRLKPRVVITFMM